MTTPDRLVPVLRDALAGSGLLLEEVTVSAAGRRSVVRVLVDRDLGEQSRTDTATDPLSLDEVAAATHAVSAALDDSDVMGESPYTLEVSSPGVTRPLTEARHFRRNVGRLMRVVTGSEPVTGRLLRVDEDSLTLLTLGEKKQPPRELTLALAEVRRGEVQVEFNRPGPGDEPEEDEEPAEADHADQDDRLERDAHDPDDADDEEN